MTCPRCRRQSAACVCQAELLPPPPAWRRELQERVDQYRARRQRRRPPPASAHAADPDPSGRRVLPFRARAEAAAPAAAAVGPDGTPAAGGLGPAPSMDDTLAEPVILPPRPRPSESPMPQPAPVWEPPPETALAGAAAARDILPPPLACEAELAESVPPYAPRRHVELEVAWPRAYHPAGGPTCLQLPLPILEPVAAAPTLCPAAPTSLRLRAALWDAAAIATAAALFAAAAWASVGFPAPDAHTPRHLLAAFAAVPVLLAGIYLLACEYAGGLTLGMRHCGLQVVALQGELTLVARRRRAWASVLSLAALGLGYAWIFFDGQGLTWHDYISRTCVAEIAPALRPH